MFVCLFACLPLHEQQTLHLRVFFPMIKIEPWCRVGEFTRTATRRASVCKSGALCITSTFYAQKAQKNGLEVARAFAAYLCCSRRLGRSPIGVASCCLGLFAKLC